MAMLGAATLAAMSLPAAQYSDWLRVYGPPTGGGGGGGGSGDDVGDDTGGGAGRSIFAQVQVTEAQEQAAGSFNFWSVPGVAANIPQSANYTVVMEGDSVSDVFGVGQDEVTGAYVLGFLSSANPDDLTGFPLGTPDGLTVFETPGHSTFDATMYLDPGLQSQGYTAEFYSEAAPDGGASLGLLSLGLAGLFGFRRKF